MAKKKENKEFGDIIENHELVKRTLMVSAYPALIKQTKKDDTIFFEGFLPGFEFASIEDIVDENEIVETLQDMLDDEVEELIVFGKSLPYVEEDEELMQKYPEYKIVYLDINVYATPEELEYYDNCSHDCSCCSHDCHGHDDCDDDCDCCDDDCDDDCEHDEECDCGCHEHEHKHSCNCNDNHHSDCEKSEDKKCNCKTENNKKHNCKNKSESKKCVCDGSKKGKGINCKDKKTSTKK